MAVAAVAVSVGYRARESGCEVSKAEGLESAQQVEGALDILANYGSEQAALSSNTFGSAGEPFRVGASASADGDPLGTSGLPAMPAAPVLASTVVDVEDFAPYGSSSGGQGSRALTAGASDPANPRGTKRRRGSNRLGITGEVADAADDAKSFAKATYKAFGLNKVHMAKQLEQLVAKTEVPVDESLRTACARYEVLLLSIDRKAKAATSWTASEIKENIDELNKFNAELDSLNDELCKTLEERKKRPA